MTNKYTSAPAEQTYFTHERTVCRRVCPRLATELARRTREPDHLDRVATHDSWLSEAVRGGFEPPVSGAASVCSAGSGARLDQSYPPFAGGSASYSGLASIILLNLSNQSRKSTALGSEERMLSSQTMGMALKSPTLHSSR